VHGITGLRIVDGSVIPQASPYLAMPEVMALAERAADIMLDEYRSEEGHRSEEFDNGLNGNTQQDLGSVEVETIAAPLPYSIEYLKKSVGAHASIMEMITFLAAPVQLPAVMEPGNAAHTFTLFGAGAACYDKLWFAILFVAITSSMAISWACKNTLGRKTEGANETYAPLMC
jgi:hypothetical protein